MLKYFEQQFKERFKNQTSFSKEELEQFFRQYEPELNEYTLASRIRTLRIKKVIVPLGNNIYGLFTKKEFTPDIETELYELGKRIADFLSEGPYCIWDSSWINQFSRHQTMRNFHIVEANKTELLPLFHFLKDSGTESVFLNPGQEILHLYARENELPIVLKPLISRSPVYQTAYNSKKLTVPTLEKMLVDIYTDTEIFNNIQGAELNTIFEKALTRYAINFTTLYAYARRRGKKEDIHAYLQKEFPHLLIRTDP